MLDGVATIEAMVLGMVALIDAWRGRRGHRVMAPLGRVQPENGE
jgi:hypothetical protein